MTRGWLSSHFSVYSSTIFQLNFLFHLSGFLTCCGHFFVDVSLRSCLLPSKALQRARHRSFRRLPPCSIQDKQSASSSGPTPGPLNKAIYHAVWPDLFGHSQGCLSLRAPALSTIPPLCPPPASLPASSHTPWHRHRVKSGSGGEPAPVMGQIKVPPAAVHLTWKWNTGAVFLNSEGMNLIK